MKNYVLKACIIMLFFLGMGYVSTTNAQCFNFISTNVNLSTNCGQPLDFTFFNVGINENASWQLNFGDPTSSSNMANGTIIQGQQGITSTHTYTTPGNYIAYFTCIIGYEGDYCLELFLNFVLGVGGGIAINGYNTTTDPVTGIITTTYTFPIYITVSAVSPSSISISGPSSVCAGTLPTFSVPAGSLNYQWQSFENGDYYNVGTNSNTYTPTTAEVLVGTHSIRVITSVDNCNSCQSASANHIFEVLMTPDFVIGANNTCENIPNSINLQFNSFSLSCQGALTYEWNTGATTENLNNVIATPNASYTVTVTCAGGCTSTDSYQFPSVLQQGPNIDLVSQDIICNGDNTSTVSIDIQPTGSSVYVYSWSNGITTQDLSAVIFTANGVSVAVKGQNGCKTVRAFSCLNPCD
jgi:hypothetical protein